MTAKEQRIEERDARAARRSKHEGDVLGISDANPDVHIPTRPGGGPVEGIEVRERATGIDDVPRRSGATGIDMGAAGEGTDIAEHPSHPKSAEDTDE